jgi:hypothetical protein
MGLTAGQAANSVTPQHHPQRREAGRVDSCLASSADRNAAARKRLAWFSPEFMPDTVSAPFCALRTSRDSGQPDDIT